MNWSLTLLLTMAYTPAGRIPTGPGRRATTCAMCGWPLRDQHNCRPEVVEDRIQRRWTVRVGGQRILGVLSEGPGFLVSRSACPAAGDDVPVRGTAPPARATGRPA